MLYRKLGRTGEMVSILGFGCMRLPVINEKPEMIDQEKATQLLHYAIDSGINYIDTAYPYHRGRSESFLGDALKDGYREKVYIATKLPSWDIKSREDMDIYLEEQLCKLKTDHIDFYLVHSLNRDYWKNLTELGLFDFLDSAIDEGKIKYAGFSFHDDNETFREIVDAYSWSLCQIQYNIVDEYYQAGKDGLMYAAGKGLGIVIMEPMRGGCLAEMVPEDIRRVWNSCDVRRSPAWWCLQYLWDYREVDVVLSGMSNIKQLEMNLKVAENGYPGSLTTEERNIISKVGNMYRTKLSVDCWGCRYCLPCPVGVNIPLNFKYLNNASIFNDIEMTRKNYINHLGNERKASNCTGCGQCESRCPQHIPIRKTLQKVVDMLEK